MKFIRPAVLEIWKGRLLGGFGRFYRECVLMSNFTRKIRNQDHQIDQKKFIPLITSDVDTSLTLPLCRVLQKGRMSHFLAKKNFL